MSAHRTRSIAAGVVVCGAALLGWVPAAHAQKSPLAGAAYARANEHLAASRFAQAADEMEIAVRFEPRFALGWYVLASASRRAGQCDRAIAAYRRYAELRPTEPDPHFGIGLCLKQVGDREGAIAAFKRYVAADARPESHEFVETARKNLVALEASAPAAAAKPPAAVLEARQLGEQGHADEAITKLQALATAEPKSAEANGELGHVLVGVRRTRDAIAPLQTAVRLSPAAAISWYDLAFALREAGQTKEAVDAYRRYITLRPQDPDAQYGLGRTLVILGRDDEALAAFRTYVALEKRPTERRWLRKAQAEIVRLEAARRPGSAAPAHGATTPPPEAHATTPSPAAHATTPPPAAHATTPPPEAHATTPPPAASVPHATTPPPAGHPTPPPPAAAHTTPPPHAPLALPPASAAPSAPPVQPPPASKPGH